MVLNDIFYESVESGFDCLVHIIYLFLSQCNAFCMALQTEAYMNLKTTHSTAIDT